MNLAIDFGNTTGKVALFRNEELYKLIHPISLDDLEDLEKEYDLERCIISSTGLEATEVAKYINCETLILSHKVKLPFLIDYDTPQTLGTDRIAAVAGAQLLFPNENSLVIDLGTCITYDLLIENRYQGGGISPGMNMRFKALNTFTKKLPLVEKNNNHPLVGKSTIESIQSGIINGIKAEIEGIIGNYRVKYGDLRIVMCGGDHNFFENKLKESIFAAPELVLKGLNGILLHNVSKG